MAINVLSLLTNNEQQLFIVDASPIVEGLSAALGSEATWVSGSTSKKYLKVGSLDTDWDLMGTAGAAGIVNAGVAGRLALYPASSNQVDDIYIQNSQNIDILVAAQGSRSSALEQTINSALIVNGDFTVHGTLTTLDTTNSTLTDKLITINKGGAAASANGSGIEFEENALITGYFKVSADRTAFDLLSPASAYVSKLSLANLTTNKVAKLADYSGTFVMRPDATPGVSSQVAYYNGTDSIVSASGFTYVAGVLTSANMTISSLGLGIAHVSAAGVISSSALSLTADVGSSILPIANGGTNSSTASSAGSVVYSSASAMAYTAVGTSGQALISGGTGAPTWFASSGVVHATSGVLSTSAVVLTSEVSGTLPVANGGTNSSTALNNNRIMVSSGGAIVEAAALTDGKLLIGSTGAAPSVASITGTSNQVTVTPGAGSITLSTPQDIHTGATPTFGALTLSGAAASFDLHDTTVAIDSKTNAYTVNTTNATVTTIATLPIASNTIQLIEVKCIGIRTGGTAGVAMDSCSYLRSVRAKNIAGTCNLLNLQSDYTSEDMASFNCSLVISGTDVLVQVTGATNVNMTFRAWITVTK